MLFPSLPLLFLFAAPSEPPGGKRVFYRVALQSGRLFEPHRRGARAWPVRGVLHSWEEERAFLERHPRTQFWTSRSWGAITRPFPLIEYATETAVVLSLGGRGSGSIRVQVDSVVAVAGVARVYATETAPCIRTMDVSHPAVVLALKGSWDVAFMPLRRKEPCF